MMDLVYILGDGSRWSDNEIRYSIRSAVAHYKFREIFVIGACPAWLVGVRHILATDRTDNKIKNAIAKYLIAATTQEISSSFVLMNDDFFFLEDVAEIPAFSRGTLREMIKRHPTQAGYYFASLKDTVTFLEKCGVAEPIDFEIHAPMVFDRVKLKDVIEHGPVDKPIGFRSVYGNLTGLTPKKVIDFKAQDLAEFAYQRRRVADYLSVADVMVARKEFREWIARRFPIASPYEADKGAGASLPPGRGKPGNEYHAAQDFEYAGKFYVKGDQLSAELMAQIKAEPTLNGLWEVV